MYGGGNWGLMGVTARTAHGLGVSVVGVVPEFMMATAGETFGQTVVVSSMAERKLKMANLVLNCLCGS